jgi:hypothetical protein
MYRGDGKEAEFTLIDDSKDNLFRVKLCKREVLSSR